MKSRTVIYLLLVINVLLLSSLVMGLQRITGREVTAASSVPESIQAANSSNPGAASQEELPPPQTVNTGRPDISTNQSLFSTIYSSDPKKFAANLRAAGCPEETVKDILTAEIGRRYKDAETALRPKPADHVPLTWSSATAEMSLQERRQGASALATEKAALLSEALGYQAPVSIPLYATRKSDQEFEQQIAQLAQEKQIAARQANLDYWSGVDALWRRTKGFWQAEDIAELERLKAERQKTLNAVASR